ncbi:hypothetical protein K7X08_000835 [Anisodus acutangulus]|uniref:Uncharacterized protein n=1 Tax=Anisodus acutangulus TaxID=402998 RepID=A0A9Q1MMT1_9SOLA|nr:hypothetical protein K7X08_000835 [Anisodus acutangulus]
MGSAEFASTVAALVAMSQGITLLLAKSLLLFFDYERPYYQEYAVGFSGVLFAMKVILNAQSDDYTYVYGANPLRTIIRGLSHALSWPLRFVKCFFRSQPRIAGRETVGGDRQEIHLQCGDAKNAHLIIQAG